MHQRLMSPCHKLTLTYNASQPETNADRVTPQTGEIPLVAVFLHSVQGLCVPPSSTDAK